MAAQTDDKVWFDSDRKFAGICSEVASPKPQLQNTLLLAHFPTTLSILEKSLRSASIEFRSYSVADSSTLCSIDGRAVIGLARAFQPAAAQLGNPFLRTLEIIVAEHYPMFSRDEEIVQAAEQLHCKPTVCFHLSLDDPLLKHFGSENIVSLFKTLGADEAECISHPLVTRAIRNAQLKIEKQVQRDLQTESMDDWFRFNIRDSW